MFKDIEMVLVAFADRLGRESFEFIQTVEEIRGNQIELYCISEGLSSDRMSPFELVMTAVLKAPITKSVETFVFTVEVVPNP